MDSESSLSIEVGEFMSAQIINSIYLRLRAETHHPQTNDDAPGRPTYVAICHGPVLTLPNHSESGRIDRYDRQPPGRSPVEEV